MLILLFPHMASMVKWAHFPPSAPRGLRNPSQLVPKVVIANQLDLHKDANDFLS